MSLIINTLTVASGLALIVCAMYLLDRARRCEISVRTAVAGLLAVEGLLAVGLVAAGDVPATACALSLISAAVAWLVIGTRYGRRCARIDTWGITRPDELHDAAHDHHEEKPC